MDNASKPYFTWPSIKIQKDESWAIFVWLNENLSKGTFVVEFDNVFFKDANDRLDFITRCPGWLA